MNSDADYTVHGSSEISGPVPIAPRKDPDRRGTSSNRKRRKKKSKPVQPGSDDQEPEGAASDKAPSSEGGQHEVDYLA